MIPLVCRDPSLNSDVRKIAEQFGLDWVRAVPESAPYFLAYDFEGLALCPADKPKAHVRVDFAGGANDHRRRFGGGKGQDIAKAVGVTSYLPTVLDATAGLGRDSFVLASLGCRVLACERHPVVAALLQDGLRRASLVPDVSDVSERITLHFGAAHALLEQDLAEQPDVIYLDPMFEHDPKQKAAVKKDMQAFRDVVGQDTDTAELLELALQQARCRVVVKRARKAEPLGGKPPSHSLTGKANRFDVYALSKVAPATAG